MSELCSCSHTDCVYLRNKRIAELDCALATKEMEFKELTEHYDKLKAEVIKLLRSPDMDVECEALAIMVGINGESK